MLHKTKLHKTKLHKTMLRKFMLRKISIVRAFASVALLILGAAARAQVAAYGMASAGFVSGQAVNSITALGGTFGLYEDGIRMGPLHLGGDARVIIENSHSGSSRYGNKVFGVLAGPRLGLSLPPLPFRPYVQAEIGLGATNFGVQPSRSNYFAYQIQGGLDFTIFPRLDIRGEYGAGQIEGNPNGASRATLQQIDLGLVLRLF